MSTTNSLTVAEAAAILRITGSEVRYLIRRGRLRAEKFGNQYAIQPINLRKIAYGKPGRPKL